MGQTHQKCLIFNLPNLTTQIRKYLLTYKKKTWENETLLIFTQCVFFNSSNTCYYARIQIFNSRHFWHSSTCLLCQWGRPSLLNNAALFVPNSSLEPGGDHKKVSKKQSGGPLSSSWIDPSLLQKKCYAHKAHCGNPIILLMLLPMTICF